jgi:hypothetical protein
MSKKSIPAPPPVPAPPPPPPPPPEPAAAKWNETNWGYGSTDDPKWGP